VGRLLEVAGVSAFSGLRWKNLLFLRRGLNNAFQKQNGIEIETIQV